MNRLNIGIFFCAGMACIILSCNNHTSSSKTTISSAADTAAKANHGSVIDARNDSVINLKFSEKDLPLTVQGTLKTQGQHVVVKVPLGDHEDLSAKLLTRDSSENIRFSQIIYPDGKADGPFGKTVRLTGHEKGVYQLVISHNLMAEGTLAKEFRLSIGR